jgi:cytochrome c peroxidase
MGQSENGSPIAPSLGVPFPVHPLDNGATPEKIDLGREIFFDKRLSRDNTISCATCHDPNHGFSDPHEVSIGVEGRKGERNSMTLLNVAHLEPLMWDGRAESLETQSLLAFSSPAEFDLPVEQAVEKLKRQGYSEKFQKVFGKDVSVETLTQALATYQRSLNAGDSLFDRYIFLKDEAAISAAAKRGFDVFLRVKCDACHLIMTPGLHPFALRYVMFTDNQFHNIGVGMDKENPDPGRFTMTRESKDWGAFKTPTLRNVALTSPYFHDGSARTLLDVVDHYNNGGRPNNVKEPKPIPNLDQAITPLNLTDEEKLQLVAFLESLTSSRVKELAQEEERAGASRHPKSPDPPGKRKLQ